MELAAQVFHLRIDEIEIIGLVDVIAPDPFGQCGFVDRMVRTIHKIEEDVVLLAQQFDFAACHLDPAAVGPQAHVARIEALLPFALVAAQDAADTGTQLRQVERLGQVIVGPEFQPFDFVVERIAGRNDDYPGTVTPRFQLFEQPQSAPAGQHDIQQDTVVIVRSDLVERGCVIGRLLDDVMFPDKGPGHNLPQGGFVFDDEYFHKIVLFPGRVPSKRSDMSSPLKTRLLGGQNYGRNPKGN